MDYDALDRLVDQLERVVEEANPQKGYWRELWALAREIGSGFKGTHYPAREDKDRAWQRYQLLMERAKARSEESKRQFERNEREWRERQSNSESLRNRIQMKAASSRQSSEFERGLGEIFFFPIRMVEVILSQLLGLKTPQNLMKLDRSYCRVTEPCRTPGQPFINGRANSFRVTEAKHMKAFKRLGKDWMKHGNSGRLKSRLYMSRDSVSGRSGREPRKS